MLSPTINNIILRLFDDASQGNPVLLNSLKILFQCEYISITSNRRNELAVNEIEYKAEDTWLTSKEYLGLNHLDIQLYDSHPNEFTLAINTKEDLYLKVEFQDQSCLKQCLNSVDITTLIPHIQQATLIANQISQQAGDNYSLNYVLSNHPCTVLSQAQTAFKPSILHIDSQIKEAANIDFHIEIDRERLACFFNFTPTESELVKLLFRGLSLDKVAESRAVSKQTIRKQLQSILKKTHADSQEALMLIIFEVLFTGLQKPINKVSNNVNPPIEHLMN